MLDYDDILLKALRLAEENDTDGGGQRPAIAFPYLFVDEFQDINDVQYRMIRAWSKSSKSIFIIGDPDQSIYGFRGSAPRYFEQFQADFPAMRQVRLTRNYRSTPEILRCAESALPVKNTAGEPPRRLAANRESGAKVRLLRADDELSEALFLAREIGRLVGGIDMLGAHASLAPGRKRTVPRQTRGFSDIAVLYRVNRQAEILEQCLRKEGIPYTVAGRSELLTDGDVQKIIAFFRFLLNPGDLMSLGICLKTLGACPADSMQKILSDYAQSDKGTSFLAAMLETSCPPSASGGLEKLMELLQRYEPAVRGERPRKLIESFLSDSALPESPSVELLLDTAVLHDGMADFLQNLVLGREADVVRNGGKAYSPDAVSLMTLHGSKGLEFPVVFLCGVNEGLLPFQGRGGQSDPGEERRLFYVGLTRAQDELILLTSSSPSPFLAGLSKDCIEEDNASARRPAPVVQQLSLFDGIRQPL